MNIDPLIILAGVNAGAISVMGFFLGDYIRFRFENKYVSPSQCEDHKNRVNESLECIKRDVESISSELDSAINRIYNRIDRMEGLIMNLSGGGNANK